MEALICVIEQKLKMSFVLSWLRGQKCQKYLGPDLALVAK